MTNTTRRCRWCSSAASRAAAWFIAEVRIIKALDVELEAIEDRIGVIYDDADPDGVVRSMPGLGVTLAAGILGRSGDLNRFDNLAGVRSFTGIVPKIDQSGLADHHGGPTKAGDPGLARRCTSPPTRPARSTPPSRPATTASSSTRASTMVSALCSIAPVVMTRIAACWRNGQRYVDHTNSPRSSARLA